MMPVPKKKKSMDNFQIALGMGVNWVDLDKGVIYHIQDYKEAMDRGENPQKIRMTGMSTGEEIGWAYPEAVAEKMKDPKPDPRYSPETPKEHQHNR